jgi:hypothetical protein
VNQIHRHIRRVCRQVAAERLPDDGVRGDFQS